MGFRSICKGRTCDIDLECHEHLEATAQIKVKSSLFTRSFEIDSSDSPVDATTSASLLLSLDKEQPLKFPDPSTEIELLMPNLKYSLMSFSNFNESIGSKRLFQENSSSTKHQPEIHLTEKSISGQREVRIHKLE
jgi:hypothetical protein